MPYQIIATKREWVNDIEQYTTKIEIYVKSKKMKDKIKQVFEERGYEVSSKFVNKLPDNTMKFSEYILVKKNE